VKATFYLNSYTLTNNCVIVFILYKTFMGECTYGSLRPID